MVQAWYMTDSNEDQREEHHQNPPKFVEINELYKLTGVEYFKIDNKNEEEVKAFEKLRFKRGYTYEDEVTVSKDKLPNYDEMLERFFKEHLHADEEIRYILEGSGYFDVRDPLDKWIRIKTEASDMIILPSGIYHRFTIDTNNYIKAKRYFIGEPVWTQFNRPADDMEVRSNYIKKLKDGFN